MQKNLLLAIGGLLAAACSQSTDPSRAASRNSPETGGLAVSGIVYGATAAPDSQWVGLEGATVTLARIGDLPPAGPGTDSSLATPQGGLRMLLDSVIPPDQPPPPPLACDEGTVVATVVTGADGSWSTAGLEEGLYRARVTPPSNSVWAEVEACGYGIREGSIHPLLVYLPRISGS